MQVTNATASTFMTY